MVDLTVKLFIESAGCVCFARVRVRVRVRACVRVCVYLSSPFSLYLASIRNCVS
jgi:hypothetical protein